MKLACTHRAGTRIALHDPSRDDAGLRLALDRGAAGCARRNRFSFKFAANARTRRMRPGSQPAAPNACVAQARESLSSTCSSISPSRKRKRDVISLTTGRPGLPLLAFLPNWYSSTMRASPARDRRRERAAR